MTTPVPVTGKIAAPAAPDELPDYIRYTDADHGVYVIEFGPNTRLISSAGGTIRFPLPWQVYVCQPRSNKMQFFARNSRLRSVNDILNYPHISNLYRNCEPCGGIPVSGRVGGTSTLGEDVERAVSHINYFWATGFNGGFYLSSQGSGHALKSDPGGCLMPKDMVKAVGDQFWYADGFSGTKVNHPFFSWIEKLSPEDLCNWEWTPAGKLSELVPHMSKKRLRH